MTVAGVILCGGKSSRMGHPKAWLPFGPEVMLQRVVRILREVVAPIVVVAADDQPLPLLPPEVIVARDLRPERGPLEGIFAGLTALTHAALSPTAAGPVEAAYISSCDVPFLSPQFIRRIVELLGDSDIAVPYVDDRHHPLAAVYRLHALPEIERLLAQNRFRPIFLFETLATRLITDQELRAVDPELKSLQNLNTAEAYKTALAESGLA